MNDGVTESIGDFSPAGGGGVLAGDGCDLSLSPFLRDLGVSAGWLAIVAVELALDASLAVVDGAGLFSSSSMAFSARIGKRKVQVRLGINRWPFLNPTPRFFRPELERFPYWPCLATISRRVWRIQELHVLVGAFASDAPSDSSRFLVIRSLDACSSAHTVVLLAPWI